MGHQRTYSWEFKLQMIQLLEKDSLCQALKRPIWNKRKNSEA